MIKKASLIISAFVVTVIISTSCGTKVSNEALEINDSSTSNEPSAAIEESSTNEVAIGNQVWMTENLNVDKFRNGDPIPEAKTDEEWVSAGKNEQPAWCYYQNDPSNGTKYGKLYNWYAVKDTRGLAPNGFHIPSDEEWTILTDNLGGKTSGTKMKSNKGWHQNGNGTNSSGFLGLPGGTRSNSGTFYFLGEFGYWWSSSEHATATARYRNLGYRFGFVGNTYTDKVDGHSVRCIRD